MGSSVGWSVRPSRDQRRVGHATDVEKRFGHFFDCLVRFRRFLSCCYFRVRFRFFSLFSIICLICFLTLRHFFVDDRLWLCFRVEVRRRISVVDWQKFGRFAVKRIAKAIRRNASCGSNCAGEWWSCECQKSPFYNENNFLTNKASYRQIHGHQLRTCGQGRKCAFSHFPNSITTDGPTNGPTTGPTDGQSLL